jgi:hypothetical protein
VQEASGVKCIIVDYLLEKEVECVRLALAANDGTKTQSEWLKTAEMLQRQRKEHLAGCKECQKAG